MLLFVKTSYARQVENGFFNLELSRYTYMNKKASLYLFAGRSSRPNSIAAKTGRLLIPHYRSV
jgi:hypothetical protein